MELLLYVVLCLFLLRGFCFKFVEGVRSGSYPALVKKSFKTQSVIIDTVDSNKQEKLRYEWSVRVQREKS